MNPLQKKHKEYIGIFSAYLFKCIMAVLMISLCSCSLVKETTIHQFEILPIHQSEILCSQTVQQKTDIQSDNVIMESDVETYPPETMCQDPELASDNAADESEADIAEFESDNITDSEKETSESASSESASDDAVDWQFYKKYSKKFGINFDGTENPELIMAVDDWLDTRFQWGGCSKNGIDCSCLVKSVFKDVYDIELNRTAITMFNDDDLIPVKKKNLKEGDLLFFKTKGNTISHVGIYLKDDQFVHASRSRGVVISNLNRQYYKKRFFSGKRIPDDRMRLSNVYRY